MGNVNRPAPKDGVLSFQDKRRAAFEALFSKPPYEFMFYRYGDEGQWPRQYRDYRVQVAWEAWNSASELEEKKAEEENEKIKGVLRVLYDALMASDEDGLTWHAEPMAQAREILSSDFRHDP